MLARTYAAALQGINAIKIIVEVNAGGQVPLSGPGYYLVGLPDNAVREGYQRIASALKNNGYRLPRVKLVINLAPADIRKEGSAYDLPIAIGILAATEQLPLDQLEDFLLMGELALDGSLRPVKGALSIALEAKKRGFRGVIFPKANVQEAAVVDGIEVYGVEHLRQVVDFLRGEEELQPVHIDPEDLFGRHHWPYVEDFSDVKGQHNIKRALEIAAAGGHNVILIGPPGSGKTMLARRLPTILPPLTLEEALETTKIHSVAGKLPPGSSLLTRRPFRAPHHTISDVALVGGGSNPMPGEISLAHNGVLFLDELPEFKRSVLEVLRQPMEERRVTISRARFTIDYPAGFMLVASMNPCPCGYYNHPEKSCTCPPGAVKRYLNKISGPLMDRIDLHIEVVPVSYDELSETQYTAERSEVIAQRVVRAREIQLERFKEHPSIFCNAQMPSRMIRQVCTLDEESQKLLRMAMERLQLSARAYDRILRVARTIADLDESKDIQTHHISEAIHFRTLDRSTWA